MGSFCESLKIEKIIAYAFNNVLLNWSIIKEGLRGFFELILVFHNMHYIRVFVNFLDGPYYEPLLWFIWLYWYHTDINIGASLANSSKF